MSIGARVIASVLAWAGSGCRGGAGGSAAANDTGTSSDGSSEATASHEDTAADSTTGDDARCCSADGRMLLRCSDGTELEACQGGEVCFPPSASCVDLCAEAERGDAVIGCEHHAVALPFAASLERQGRIGGTCMGVVIANPTDAFAHIRVERDGHGLDLLGHLARYDGAKAGVSPEGFVTFVVSATPMDPAIGIPPRDVALLPLAGHACDWLMPGFDALAADADRDAAIVTQTVPGDPLSLVLVRAQTGRGHAFRIVSDVPVAVQQIAPFVGAWTASAGGSTLIPSSRWGDSFIVDAPAPTSPFGEGSEDPNGLNPFVDIVARDDDTLVTVTPSAPVGGGPGVPSAFPDAPFSLRLAAGEHVQLVESSSLAGSTIAASAPVGVFIGHECAALPNANADCDHVERMLLPSALLGGERVALGPSRVGEPVQWKLIGAVDDTRLEYSDGIDAPSTLAAGEAVEFAADSAFVVRSQDDAHPFRLLSVMHNCGSLDQVTCPGDAEQLELGGTALYVEDATFFVDPTFARTQLLVVRVADPEFADVRLPCAVDELVGEWSPVGDDGRFEVARADFDIPGGRYDACEGGLHRMTSDAPFGAWVWSWDSGNSIAYPVALGTAPYHDAGPGEQ